MSKRDLKILNLYGHEIIPKLVSSIKKNPKTKESFADPKSTERLFPSLY